MKKYFYGLVILILAGCNKNPLQPELIHIQLTYDVDQAGAMRLGPEPSLTLPMNQPILGKQATSVKIDQVRVMALDFSIYESSNAYFASNDYKEYARVRDSWPGDLNHWAEWEKLLGDYFRIISDQALMIEKDLAKGSVAGTIGLNRVLVAMIADGDILYWGEGDVIGVQGKAVHCHLTMYPTTWN